MFRNIIITLAAILMCGCHAFKQDRTSSWFTGTCDYIKSFGGATFAESVENYLLSIGVSQQNISEIRTKMLK